VSRLRAPRPRTLLFLLAAVVPLCAPRPASATIKYRVSLAHAGEHLFQIEMEIPSPAPGTQVAMPAWNALYQVRDFTYRIRSPKAVISDAANGGEQPVELRPIDKQTWEIEPLSAQLAGAKDDSRAVVSYAIQWNDPGPFNSQLNDHHAFVNFAEILMYVPNRRSEDTEVSFSDLPPGWKLLSELPAGHGAGSFQAESYDALVDAPVEAGKFSAFAFDNQGAHFRVAVDATEWDKGLLEADLKRITSYELSLMGGPPYKEYTFFFHIGPYADVGGGGMEHANCTAISAASVESGAAIAAHEFFHAWNVKRIRPRALEPVDYTQEQKTRALWFAEGVTSAYASYALVRSGLWNKGHFYDDLAMQIGELEARPARQWQSVEESSLDAWLEKYDDYNTPDRSISYYNKGQLVGVLLDLSVRDATGNRKSLDDIMRQMYTEYAKAGKFYDESGGIERAVEEIADKPYGDFFHRFVSGTDAIPYGEFLGLAGLQLKLQTTNTADLGFWPQGEPGKDVTVSSLEPGSPAEIAGLHDGDVILPSDNKSSRQDFAAWLRARSIGDRVALRVRRDGQESEISFLVGARQDRQYSIVEMPQPSDQQRRIRDGLLHGTTD
jgi:predicted metalloprotease with PDZ domain